MITAGDVIPLGLGRNIWRYDAGDSIPLPLGATPLLSAHGSLVALRAVLSGSAHIAPVAMGSLVAPRAVLSGSAHIAPFARGSLVAPRALLSGSASVPFAALGALQPTVRPVLAGAALIIIEARAELQPTARPWLDGHATMYFRLCATTRQTWQMGETRSATLAASWDRGEAIRGRHVDALRPAPAHRAVHIADWQRGPARLGREQATWQHPPPFLARYLAAWQHGPTRSAATLQPWRLAYRRGNRYLAAWQHGPAVHQPLHVGWQPGAVRCRIWVDSWEPGRAIGARHAAVWQPGWIRLLWPRPVILPPTPRIGPDIAPGDTIPLPLLALWLAPGDRIRLPIGGPFTRGTWRPFIMPVLSIVRLPDRAEIRATAFSYDADLASWTDEANITLQHATDFDTAKAAAEIEINMQGYVRRMVIVTTAINRRHGEATYSLQARSPTIYLGPGWAPVLSYTQASARTAQQLAANGLPDGWSLNWGTVDWTLPGGLYTADRETPIDTIKRLAGVVQAVVLPSATADEVIVAPAHTINSWEWANANPYLIPAGAVIYSQYAANPSIPYNAVYISGTRNGGIERRILRSGTAGDIKAPDLTSELFVSDDPAMEAGRIILSQSGRIGYQTVELPLAEAPNHPTLLPLGALVEVNDGQELFRGIVTQVKVDIAFGSMPKQTVTIERHE